MGAGGKRAGAGRPRGRPNKASIARELAVSATGLSPRDVMIGAMRHWWDVAAEHSAKGNRRLADQYLVRAVNVARDVAVFVHPKAGGGSAPNPDDPPAKVHVIISGGLPEGSTPDKPEGTNYSEVPEEQPAWFTPRANPSE
jgi:hypothetical protein